MPNALNANDTCRWCASRLGTGNHSLCRAWCIFRIKEYISDLEDFTIFLENLVDELEYEPD